MGTIRNDYAIDLVRNGCHGSDSVQNVQRERNIVGLIDGAPSDEKHIILDWLKKRGEI